MDFPTGAFLDKETLLDVMTEMEGGTPTEVLEEIQKPIVAKAESDEEADDMVADALLARYDRFMVVQAHDQYGLYGILGSSSILLAYL